jgi:2-methylcitrate dehydratase PrpD
MNNSSRSISEELGLFIQDTTYESLPEDIVLRAKERVLDTLAACLAGSYGWEYPNELIESLGCCGTGESVIFGRAERKSSAGAAMINAAFAHAVELDDGHRNAGVHAGATIVPTALAVGTELGSSGKDVLAAIVLGYDVTYRFARNMTPAEIEKGFHPSATCGTLGSAAVTAKLLKCGSAASANTLGLAGLQAAGLMEATLSGQTSKCVMVGHGALAGILSGFMASKGLPSPQRIFEGKSGLLQAMSRDVPVGEITKDLGGHYEISDTYVKLYPTCRHCHVAIEGIAALKEENGFSPEDVDRIAIGTFPIAYNLTGKIHEPEDTASARFSMPFAVAVSLVKSSVGMADLEGNALSDPNLRSLARKVEVRVDQGITSEFPKKRGAKIEVFLKDGRTLEKTVFTLKGSPDLPVGWEDLRRKFINCAAPVFEFERSCRIIEGIHSFEELPELSGLMTLLARGN